MVAFFHFLHNQRTKLNPPKEPRYLHLHWMLQTGSSSKGTASKLQSTNSQVPDPSNRATATPSLPKFNREISERERERERALQVLLRVVVMVVVGCP
jgi:hypothetical protein